MKVDLEIGTKELNEKLQSIYTDKTIAVWGTGQCLENFYQLIPSLKRHVACYVDKSVSKQGTYMDNILIVSPENFFEKEVERIDVLIIATMHYAEIVEQMHEVIGWNGEIYSAFHVVFREGQLAYKPLEDHMDELRSLFHDDKSLKILEFILEHRKKMDIDFSEIYEPNQYFIEGLVPKYKDAIFVDGGAYHGETIDDFVAFQQGKFERIYSFEMDKTNYNQLVSRDYGEKVKLFNYGLWNEHTTCRYSSNGTSSALDHNSNGDMVAECVALDEVLGDERVTYIKMDIEGAELNALWGAEYSIKSNRPNLAICVYHKPEDIYELTKLLHEWLPDHKLFLRHHSRNFTETVLYVIRRE